MPIRFRRTCLPLLLLLAALARTASAQDVLNETSHWRVYATWRTPTLVDKAGKLKPLYTLKTGKPVPVTASPPPPKNWMAADFDDSDWGLSPGRFILGPGYGGKLTDVGGNAELHAVYLRGRFRVTDPPRVMMLKFALRYVGGAVVYVNGQELQRGHLPKGKLAPDVLAEPYPLKNYLRPDDRLLHELTERKLDHVSHKEWEGRFRSRVRDLPPKGWLTAVAVPGRMLRKGVNIIAVANFAAPHNEIRLTGKFRQLTYQGPPSPWPHAGIHEAKLHVAPSRAIEPNIKRREGIRVWNRRIGRRVSTADYGDACQPLGPIRLVGVRNGSFSGQVVLGTTELIEGLKATATALAGPDGAAIPQDRVRVRFAYTDRYFMPNAFDVLLSKPPAEIEPPPNQRRLLPVWVTVQVPADATPGDYKGTLKIEPGEADPVEVPIELKVVGWTLPDSKQWATHIELIQSPDTLAVQYKVPLWSDEHWTLIDRSFALLGQVGAKTLHIPVISRTYMGNEHSRIRWVKQGSGYTHDFSLVEKYLDTAIKHLGKIPLVVIYCRDHNTGSYYFGKKEISKPKGMPYTELDPKSGALTERIGPMWGTPECRAFWKPVMDGLYEILKTRGLEKSFLVGVSGDKMPSQKCVDDLKAVAPYAGWVSASHANRTALHGQVTAYVTDVWSSAGLPPSPEFRWQRKALGWNDPRVRVPFPRAGGHRFVGPSLRVGTDFGAYHRGPEGAILSGVHGYGRCGADFWPVYKKDWRFRGVLARYPESAGWHGGNLVNSYPYILGPGPDGPVATARLENLRAGVQENEARVSIEKAMVAGKLAQALAAKCKTLLDDRAWVILRSRSTANVVRGYYQAYTEKRAEALFALAAEVAAATK